MFLGLRPEWASTEEPFQVGGWTACLFSQVASRGLHGLEACITASGLGWGLLLLGRPWCWSQGLKRPTCVPVRTHDTTPQGEAGVVVPDDGYLRKAQQLLHKHKALLIADEVSGLGRAGSEGKLWHGAWHCTTMALYPPVGRERWQGNVVATAWVVGVVWERQRRRAPVMHPHTHHNTVLCCHAPCQCRCRRGWRARGACWPATGRASSQTSLSWARHSAAACECLSLSQGTWACCGPRALPGSMGHWVMACKGLSCPPDAPSQPPLTHATTIRLTPRPSSHRPQLPRVRGAGAGRDHADHWPGAARLHLWRQPSGGARGAGGAAGGVGPMVPGSRHWVQMDLSLASST